MEENIQIQSPPPPQSRRRSPVVAGILSLLCPGLGHIYAGNITRGITIAFLMTNLLLLEFAAGLYFMSFPIVLILILINLALIILIISNAARYTSGVNEKTNNNYILKSYNRWYYYFIAFFAPVFYLFLIARIFGGSMLIEAYIIPTGSMENTFLPGDHILVNKLAYGVHTPFSNDYLVELGEPHRNDNVVYRTQKTDEETHEKILYIKRCIAVGGDTILIENKKLYLNGVLENPEYPYKLDNVKRPQEYPDTRIFPKNSEWNEDYYGPIVIPKKNDVLKIDSANIEGWKDFILGDRDEYKLITKLSSQEVMNEYAADGSYTVRKDYIFVLGDSRNNSRDSRFIGFIPVEDVLGKVMLIYYSKDFNTDKSRPKRILKNIY